MKLSFRRLLRYCFAFDVSKRLFNALLPLPARRRITSALDLDTGPFNRPIDGVKLIPVQPGGYLAVYYKHYGGDDGPGISLYVLENEVLRFDCFGEGRGHYHSLPCLTPWPSKERLAFAAADIPAQIDQSTGEIAEHYAVHLERHFRPCVRNYRFEGDRLDAAVAEAREWMLASHRDGSVSARPSASIPSGVLRTGRAGRRSR